MENYVGKRLDGRYEVQEIIGVGGMSVVYKAYDNVDDRIVAVKILKDEFADDEEFVRRFKNESKAIAVLSHPNIVRVYDVSFGERIKYIVMEYVDGITLKEYIQKQRIISWNDAVFFTTQILKALQHAHDKGIVHRDIKPQNIILLPTGNIKVTDFGIARFSRTETKTLTENAIGSVHYISPEQAKGEFTDERADIYSLGVVLYEMLAGKVPFEADSAVSVALMQLQKEPQRLTEINPNIPLGIEQICNHAMQKNPQDRYQTATEMLFDLEEVIRNPQATFDYSYFVDREPTKYVIKEEKPAEIEPEPEYIDDEPEPRNTKKIIVAVVVGVILLIAAIVGLVVYMTQGVNTDTHTLENFKGQYYDDLVSSDAYDYNFVAEYQASDEFESGVVFNQTPAAGEKVISGSTVTLYVATSGDDITVPNCYTYTVEQAKRAMDLAKITNYKISEVSSETVEEGRVIYTDPKANSVISSDRQVVIYVSTGPSTTQLQTYKIPDVTGLTQSDAQNVLKSIGFTNVIVSTEDNTVRKGIVLSQKPSSGSTVQADEKITITVSTGVTTTQAPEEVTITVKVLMPNCIDKVAKTHPVDNLYITLNGKEYASKKGVKLDGSTYEFAVPIDYGTTANISVSLSEIGASHNYSIKEVSKDEVKTVDFTSYSDSDQE